MHILRKPDVFDYVEFTWNLGCCLFVSAMTLIPICFAAVCVYAVIGCRIAQIFN